MVVKYSENLTIKIKADISGKDSLRINLGIQYFLAAIHNKNLAIRCEQSDEAEKYQLHCIESIIFSFLSIEALINEFFLDAIDEKKELKDKLGEEVLELYKSHWRQYIRSKSTLHKYHSALFLAKKHGYDLETQPYKAINDLRDLGMGRHRLDREVRWDC